MDFDYKKNRCAGFTLIETAIVVGIFAVVITAIWAAASSALESKRVYQTAQRVSDVITDIRMRYINKNVDPSNPFVCEGSIIEKLLKDDVIDNSWVSGIGSSMRISTAAGKMDVMAMECVDQFPMRIRIILENVTSSACTALMFSKIDYKDATIGLTRVYINDTVSWEQGKIECDDYGICGPGKVHWTLDDVLKKCRADDTGRFVDIGWEFKMLN